MRFFLLFAASLFLSICSCSDDSTSSRNAGKSSTSMTVAVVLPLDKESFIHWENTVGWFKKNLETSLDLSDLDSGFTINVEWHDENTESMDSIGKTLASRNDIAAIIGPSQSAKLDTVASYCGRKSNQKTLIAPFPVSSEVLKKHAGESWFFALAESDITQNEILVNQVASYGAKSIALLAQNSVYGATFIDWFAFHATEAKLDIKGIFAYDDTTEVDSTAKAAFKSGAEYIVCVPDNYMPIQKILKARAATKSKAKIIFGNSILNANILQLDNIEGIEGFAIGPDPSSGFNIAYNARFSTYPIMGESQLYDALLLTALAKVQIIQEKAFVFYRAIKQSVSDTSVQVTSAWEAVSMSRIFNNIANDEPYNISGASGNISPNPYSNSLILKPVYTHWIINDGIFLPLEYVSSEGAGRVVSSTASLNIDVANIEDIIKEIDERKDHPLTATFALLVATSNGWLNYRHQADVLKIYQKLKKWGIKDDNIILIIENDLVRNKSNPYPGVLLEANGDTLFKEKDSSKIEIDYITSKIHPDNLTDILTGKESKKLPHVIKGDSTTNIFVFWSGHGKKGSLRWGPDSLDRTFTYASMETLLDSLSKQRKYRKILWMTEACYSGSICKAFEDLEVPQAACITAANENETSKADLYSADLKTYTSNSFTKAIMTDLNKIDPQQYEDVSIKDLYYHALRNTYGSHVSIYNAKNFTNLGVAEFGDFLKLESK